MDGARKDESADDLEMRSRTSTSGGRRSHGRFETRPVIYTALSSCCVVRQLRTSTGILTLGSGRCVSDESSVWVRKRRLKETRAEPHETSKA